MNSSMLAGERRWASQRRGGMTVLGKVAVPKPINLPSQRLENHGLDPNVEIVPKGTVSWGSRTSSSGSNPWTSSSLSPNADGGTVSPSNLSGRPSSGGSGTRPSTSGSDRTNDPALNSWGSNSRPSSASGTLSSNQTSSASLRPRSAENRPNSSQLSRFAEPVSKSSTAWGSSVTAERLGVKSSMEDGFSLSSGDFPTLGSEKDSSVKITEPEDPNRPSSADGRLNQTKEGTIPHTDVKHGTLNTWKADDSQGVEDEIHPSMEKWQGDPHQYSNGNTAPQHFDAWRGPPMNGPAGIWYGGQPRGPAFGAPVAPGGFAMEPYPYYHRPQVPPPLAGSQPFRQQGPRGPHPKNGDLYRPQIPDAYPHPGFRHGFFRGPSGPMAFEGYYGPPMGYRKSERDTPHMGMAAGPSFYNGYPPSNPDISNSHSRAAGRGPAGKTMSEQMEADHWDDAHGPKRVPRKSHNEFDQREGGNREREQCVQPNVSDPGRSHIPVSSRKTDWGAEEDTEGANTSHSYESRGHSDDIVRVKSLEDMGNVKPVNDYWTSKSESPPLFPPVVPPLPFASDRDSSFLAANKNSALVNKIDGVNSKFRASDGRTESGSAYNDRERKGSTFVDMKICNNTGEVNKSTAVGPLERTPFPGETVSASRQVIVPVGNNPMQSIAVVSRRPYHGGHDRVGRHGKGKFNDGWQRKILNTEFSSAVTTSNSEAVPRADGPNIVGEASESHRIDSAGKIDGDSVEAYDLTDIQCAKTSEIARQRALQLQKEEEERITKQKTRALAKLKELNRRTISGEAANQKADQTLVIGDTNPAVQEEQRNICCPMIAELKMEEYGFNLVPCPAVTAVNKSNTNQAGESIEERIATKGTDILESNVSPVPMNEDSHDSSTKKQAASQVNDGGFSRHKRTGYKQRQNNSFQKSLNGNSVSIADPELQKDHAHAATNITVKEGASSDVRLSESHMPNNSNTVVDPPSQQRRKFNRTNVTKPKMDESHTVPAILPVVSDTNHGNELIDKDGSNDSLSNLDNSVPRVTGPETGVPAQEVCSSLPNEESQSRLSNRWQPHQHHSRRLPKNQQSHRFNEKHHSSDTVVWAPVRSQSKAKDSDEPSSNSIQGSANSVEGNNVELHNLKGKRAEIERYVPKPVAKELAQHGNVPSSSSSVTSSRSNEGAWEEQPGSVGSASPQPVSSITAHSRSSVEINEGDSSHNRHKRDHGAWKQRDSPDSSHKKGVYTGPILTSEPIKDVQQSEELVQSVRTDVNTTIVDTKISVKDPGATGRGKRHPEKGPRNISKNPDSGNTFSGEIEGSSVLSAAPDVNQTDRNITSKEKRTYMERASPHWQPKSNQNSANNQHGSRTTGSDVNRIPKKDHPQHMDSSVAEELLASHHQEFDREKKPAPVKDQTYSPSQDPVGSGESTANTADQLERDSLSGSRRNGRQSSRPARGHDSRGDWSARYDNRPHNTPALRERQKQNVHYKYQPVGPVKGNKPEKAELGDGGADSTNQRHRERGHGHLKREGDYYRRPNGGVHTGSGRDQLGNEIQH